MLTATSGFSDAAVVLEQALRRIEKRCESAVTLSRQEALDSVWEAWLATEGGWKLSDDETAITEEVRNTAIRFVEALPLGFPQPAVAAEPDGHINFEWYRSPRRLISVSIGPANKIHWAALIGSESPRGVARFIDRLPNSILHYVARVFEG